MTLHGARELERWLSTDDADLTVDDYSDGRLSTSEACELAQDFGVTFGEFRRALDRAAA